MEKLIKGTGLSEKNPEAGESSSISPFVFSMSVRQGHEECGDSAFVFCDGERFIAGVFDGVSGEPGAASASSGAAKAALDLLKGRGKAGEKEMKEAMIAANDALTSGFTTATLLWMDKKGSFTIACVGDSPVYGIDSKGEVSSELPQSRSVKDDHSILNYLYYRNLITSVLGPSGLDIDMHVRKGVLSKGEVMILATDGLQDNLYFKVNDGYVSDTAGTADLSSLIKDDRDPASIVRLLMAEAKKRMGSEKSELPGRMMAPKKDDIAIIAVRMS